MGWGYVMVPFVAWLIAGSTKFTINSIRVRRLAFDKIGYGYLPSNHSAIVSSVATLVAFREGVDHPAFGVSLTLAFIVMLDANSLRRQIGRQAEVINRMNDNLKKSWGQIYDAQSPPYDLRDTCVSSSLELVKQEKELLCERMGHTRLEIAAGIGVGIFTAWLVHQFF